MDGGPHGTWLMQCSKSTRGNLIREYLLGVHKTQQMPNGRVCCTSRTPCGQPLIQKNSSIWTLSRRNVVYWITTTSGFTCSWCVVFCMLQLADQQTVLMDKLYFYVLQTDQMLIKWLPDCKKNQQHYLGILPLVKSWPIGMLILIGAAIKRK